jgi:hypothetical protein
MCEQLRTESNRSVVNQTEMPLPSELSTVFLGGLFRLALFAAVYAAREIVLPVVLVFVLHLLLAPALRVLEWLRRRECSQRARDRRGPTDAPSRARRPPR